MNAPAPPIEGIPAGSAGNDAQIPVEDMPPSAEALALAAIQIGKVTLNDVWLLCEAEYSRANTTAELHRHDAKMAQAGSLKQRMHASIAAEHYARRDGFFAMCRLVERIKGSEKIKAEIRDIADREKSDLASAVAAYQREIASELGFKPDESEATQ